MIRWLLLALFLVTISFAANAEEAGPSEKIPPGGTLRGTFSEKHFFTNSAKPMHSEGHFTVAPGYGIIWIIEKPLPLTLVITPTGMTQALGNVPLLQISATRMPLLSQATDMIGNALAGNWRL